VAASPDLGPQLMRDLALGSTDNAPKELAELITVPSLNIRGMASSRIGNQASNVIPATATASIDMRLVKGMDPVTTATRFIEHVRKQGYFVVDAEPTLEVRMAHSKVAKVVRGTNNESPWRLSMELPIFQDIIRAVEGVRGDVVKIPNSGATNTDVPGRALGIPQVGVPIANHDNNQHSYNENLRLQKLWDGIELMAALLTL
jgi:acetylornithine deacetylase/succinyl-diaminopimelate desuccinylase-like protein